MTISAASPPSRIPFLKAVEAHGEADAVGSCLNLKPLTYTLGLSVLWMPAWWILQEMHFLNKI